MSNDLYELHWNNHTKLLKRTFDSFRNDNDLIDVTLSCEGKQLKAHKIILSACSLYFLELFKENPCRHPIIILRDIKYQVMVDILNFMYMGEVNISMENLNLFLKTAEYLQVKGLTEELIKNYSEIPDKINQRFEKNYKIETEEIYSGKKSQSSNLSLSSKTSKSSSKTIDSIEFVDKSTNIIENDDILTVNQNEEEMEEVNEEVEEIKAEVIDLEDLTNSDDNIEETEQSCETQLGVLSNLSGIKTYPCPHCDKVFSHRVSLKLHLPKHSGSTQCTFCSAVLCRRYELKRHMRKVHNIEMNLPLL